MFLDRQRGFQARNYWQEMNKRSHRLTSQSLPCKVACLQATSTQSSDRLAYLIDLVSVLSTHFLRIQSFVDSPSYATCPHPSHDRRDTNQKNFPWSSLIYSFFPPPIYRPNIKFSL